MPLQYTQSPRAPLAGPAAPPAVVMILVIVVVVAALYFGRDIFVPLALAVLLSFALAPPLRRLRRLYMPNLPAVLTVVGFAFIGILAFVYVLAWQVADLASQLPRYQRNIEAKIEAVRESPPGGHLFERVNAMFRDLGRKIEEAEEAEADASLVPGATAESEEEPLPVEVVEPPPTQVQLLRRLAGSLIEPLATAGIVVVLVIFLLLKREDLRDRVIRLVGPRDLPRAAQAMNDAAGRVGQYLLMQLVVNVTYGIPVAVGLWLIGVPNPILWGMLCTVLRFVPYIGPVLGAFFPLALAIAVDPGWTTFLWAGALFVVLELISNNIMEPVLYGASTGISPVAIIAAAIFWTWLWGPVGLLLSTPLTVCLVVLGRHVPQFAFLDVLFGSEPALSAPEQLYQRLLVGDPHEATERAEEYLREHSLTGFYGDVAIPALTLAEFDRARGALDGEQLARLAESAMLLVDNLAEWEEPPAADRSDDAGEPDVAVLPEADRIDAGAAAAAGGPLVVSAGARGVLDDAAAAMLGQLLERRGARIALLPYRSLQTAGLRELRLTGVKVVVLSYMNADSLAHGRFLVRRLRRRFPGAIILTGLWTMAPDEVSRRDPLTATGADRVPLSLADAVCDVAEALEYPAELPASETTKALSESAA